MATDRDFMTLHRDSLVIDSHNDTIVSHIRRGNLGLDGNPTKDRDRRSGTVAYLRGLLDAADRKEEAQIDFPKMRAGGIDAAFFAVDVTRAWKNHLTYALDALGYFEEEVERLPGEALIARSAEDILRAKGEGKLAAILVVENSDGLEGSLNVLRMLHRVGVRSIGLTHNPRSEAADGNAEERNGSGLTTFGVRLVEEMNRLGVLVDVSHINERGFWDVMGVTRRPVVASHSDCKAVCDHPRNLTDRQIEALAKNGGVMGVTFVPGFVDAEAPTLERLLDHIDHAVKLVGPDHVGIGSDFDGGGTALKDATAFPRITEGLLNRGYSEGDVRKILGENHLRVLREAIG
ncbi:MAG: membrane dipeptidase [Candidatus Latescibacteria bacterium]|nr:membrane dipeptidase [Candidatus Latescibacterota bacterium]